MKELEIISKYANECAGDNECTVEKLNLNRRTGVLYIEIERIDGTFMDINLCTKISKEFCKMLQVYAPNIKNAYDIEIASTGIDKTLKINLKMQEFSKYINRTINAQFYNQDNQVQQGLFIINKAEEEMLFLTPVENISSLEKSSKSNKLKSKLLKTNEEPAIVVKYDKLIKVKLSYV